MKYKNNWMKYKFCIALLLVATILFSCSSDNDDVEYKLMKSWQLTSQTKNEVEVELSPCEKQNILLFSTQNVCYSLSGCTAKTIRTAWNYDSGTKVLNISDFLPITYYVDAVGESTLTLSYYKYSSVGVLEKYTEQYVAVETILSGGKLELKH